MSYEHDRNSFGKLLTPPFRKYMHCKGYLPLIFVKCEKRKFFAELNTLKMVANSRSKNIKNFEKSKLFFIFLTYIVIGVSYIHNFYTDAKN